MRIERRESKGDPYIINLLGFGNKFMRLNIQVSEETRTHPSGFQIRIAWQASSPEIPLQ